MDINNALLNAHKTLKGLGDLLSIVLVAHVLAPRGYYNEMQRNCSETEHFSTDEFSEIYHGIVDAGFFIRKIFFSEFDFIKDIISEPTEYASTVVFNLCRNGTGMNKKTVVPAICDLLKVNFTSSSAGHCAVARNKNMFSSYLSANGIRCPISGLNANDLIKHISQDTMVICKPNYGSASQSVNMDSIVSLKEAAAKSNGSILIQEYIDGYECEVPVFSFQDQCFVMPPVGISFDHDAYIGILSDTNSMTNNYGFYDISNIISKECYQEIIYDAEKAFKLLGIETYGRIDFRIDKDTNKHYLIDISTTPYVTRHSSFAFAINKSGLQYSDIFRLIIAAALCRNCNP
jgi:D-alanine-D-alanine ligase